MSRIILVLLVLITSATAHAADGDERFRIYRVEHHRSMSPQGLIDVLNTPEARAVVSAAAAAYGIPPEYVSAGLGVVALAPSTSTDEDILGIYPFDAGYVFCRGIDAAQVSATSETWFDSRGHLNGVGVYSRVKKHHLGGPGEFLGVVINVLAVKAEYREQYDRAGFCRPPDSQLFYCTGKTCACGEGFSGGTIANYCRKE